MFYCVNKQFTNNDKLKNKINFLKDDKYQDDIIQTHAIKNNN